MGLNYRFSISSFLRNRFLHCFNNNFFFFEVSIITMFAITTIITIAINFPGFENILTKFTSIFTIENSEECMDFKKFKFD